MYGRDALHSFAVTQTGITPDNAANLSIAWTFPTSDAVSATPTVVAGVVYVGAWDGFFYALDASSGAQIWSFQLDCQPAILPIPPQCLAAGQTPPDRTNTDGGMVTSSALVQDGLVYFAGGRTLYCLNASDGSLVWKHVVCGNPDDAQCETDTADPTEIWSSPELFEGKIYVGHSVDGKVGYRGGILALDATSGAQVWTFEVDPNVDSSGNPTAGGQNRGCGSVWSSAAIDDENRQVYFGTGDCQSDATPPYHEAILALDVDTGAVKWAFRPRQTDTCDFDFGASVNILDLDGVRHVGVGGKDGTYYVLDAASSQPGGQLLWSANVVFGGGSGGFIGTAAFDGSHIYGGTAYGDLGQNQVCNPSDPRDMDVEDPSLHAFDARTGTVLWEQSHAYTFGATTWANGVLFNGVGELQPPAINAYSATDGTNLANVRLGGAMNSGAAVVGKTVFIGTGDSNNGAGGGVTALSVP